MNQKPNILLLVGDHQAYYGHENNHQIRRPCYDRMVSKGVDFQRAYCSTPLCCPSRRTLATGLYASHHGQINNQVTADFNYETYMDVLKKENYDIYYFGKWHAGKGNPGDFGAEGAFCDDYGNPYLMPAYQKYLEEKNLPFPSAMIEHNWCTPEWISNITENTEYSLDRETMNECVSGILSTPKETHEAFYLAYEACKKLEECKGQDRCFCMRVDFWGPHQPYLPTREYADLYDPETIGIYPSFGDNLSGKPDVYHFEGGKGISENYRILTPNPVPWKTWAETLSRCYAQITMTDEAAGQILKKLEDLGMMENTLVIWTADHGDGIACHGGHFDKDAYMAEEVLRIPFGVRFDGRISAGEKSQALVSNVDFAATIVAAAGSKFSGNMDGKNLLSLWKKGAEWRTSVYAETFGHHFPHRGWVLTDARYKYVRNKEQMEELYNLEEDPYELRNLVLETQNEMEVQRVLAGKRRELDSLLGEDGKLL